VFREALGVDGRRGDDEFRSGRLGRKLFHVAEEKIDVEAPLVRLVDDQRVVLPQLPVALGFASRMPSVMTLM